MRAKVAVRHPLFARVYARLSVKMEEQGHAQRRVEMLAGLSGRVIEVGAGNGLNFAHYPTRSPRSLLSSRNRSCGLERSGQQMMRGCP